MYNVGGYPSYFVASGGAGDDTIYGKGLGRFYGDEGNDTLVGRYINPTDDSFLLELCGAVSPRGCLRGRKGARVAFSGTDGPNDPRRYGGDGDDTITAYDITRAFGDEGDDTLVAYDSAEAFGGKGDDVLVGHDNATVRGHKGEDIIVARDSAKGFGGDDNDTVIAFDDAVVYQGDDESQGVYLSDDPERDAMCAGLEHYLCEED